MITDYNNGAKILKLESIRRTKDTRYSPVNARLTSLLWLVYFTIVLVSLIVRNFNVKSEITVKWSVLFSLFDDYIS